MSEGIAASLLNNAEFTFLMAPHKMQIKRVVIIGGGFSGTITAINLARLTRSPLDISIIDKNPVPCRGIAYNTRNGSHLLNVLARNMSALADQPNHFVDWLGTRSEYLDEPVASVRERFIPRRVYGDYLQNLFHWYSRILADEKQTQMQFIQDEATDVIVRGETATMTLASGKTLEADKVVLAVGNLQPSRFPLRGLDMKSARYIGNPWIGWEQKLPPKNQDLLIIGAGLTMVDAFLSLRDLNWQGKIYAVSRNGLLPLSHFKGFDYPDLLNDETAHLPFSGIFSIFKKHYKAAKAKKLNPAILVDKLRPFTQRIWQNFSVREKKQFNRLFKTRWNVMRHRIAPEIHQSLQDAIAQNKLEVIKGRLRDCVEEKDRMLVGVESNGVKRVLAVGAIINCTGPQENYVPSESSLFNNLFEHGMVQPDELNMGIKVGAGFSVVDRSGHPSHVIFAMGALMKGTLWETTAVPELRSQAFRLAEVLSRQIDEAADKPPIAEVVENVLEYSI